MKRFVLLFMILFLFGVPQVSAQAEPFVVGEHIELFDSAMTVDETNTVTITETIRYNFGSLQRHGIKRFVPYRTQKADSDKFFYYEFDFKEAKLDGGYVQDDLSREGEYEVVRLGDANRTITGVHDYSITYTMQPVLLKDNQGDYLNWNITGNYWDVPIKQSRARITFASSDAVLKTRCYTGPAGSTDSECSTSSDKNVAVVETSRLLNAKEGLTINTLVPKGAIASDAQYQEAIDRPLPNLWPMSGYIFGVAAIAIGSFRKVRTSLEQKRLRDQEIIVAQYEAPDGLSPGEIGHLSDNSSSMAEITATIIDLAVRGFLKIEQTQEKGLLKKADFTLHRLKGKGKLKSYEQKVLDMLLPAGVLTNKISDITPTTAAPIVSSVKSAFKASLNEKGYYNTARPKRSPIMKSLAWIAFLIVVISNVYALFDYANVTFVMLSFAAMFVGLGIGAAIAYTIRLTKAGYDQWAKVEGLKLYLTVAEKDRLNFHDAPEKTPKHFNALLPYAIALGVETAWAKQFEGIDVTESTDWYSGSSSRMFNSSLLAHSISSEFSSVVSSNVTPTQSSSGYSGGGSSGGGGGGGGGGSW